MWRKRPTPEGYTHDWTVLVRGEEGQDIRHFVEKVVFLLHESFPKPRRGTRLWVWQISESVYHKVLDSFWCAILILKNFQCIFFL